jgi:hypothetical protein
MKLLNTTTTERHLLKIEQCIKKTNRLVAASIAALNEGYYYLWSLPDEELQEVLQTLLDNGKLQELFTNHYLTAVSLNEIQDRTDAYGGRAIAAAGREFIIEDGQIVLIISETPEIEEDDEPDIEIDIAE